MSTLPVSIRFIRSKPLKDKKGKYRRHYITRHLSLDARALQSLAIDVGHALMVGDGIEADIRGAQRAGTAGVLVRTEKFRQADLERSAQVPDAVIDLIADLPVWLDARR